MSLPRTFIGVATAALVIAALPVAAHAQAARRTACIDGSTTSRVDAKACDSHGGINKVRTAALNRAAKNNEPAHVAQAGTPAPAKAKPHYEEERRGWRWSRHHDERRHEEKRLRCRDGRYESAEGKGKNVCKHHGGIAH
jgi:hypothetical protein